MTPQITRLQRLVDATGERAWERYEWGFRLKSEKYGRLCNRLGELLSIEWKQFYATLDMEG